MFDGYIGAACVGCGRTDRPAFRGERLHESCNWVRVNRDQGQGVCIWCYPLVQAWDAGEYAPKRVQIGPTDV